MRVVSVNLCIRNKTTQILVFFCQEIDHSS